MNRINWLIILLVTLSFGSCGLPYCKKTIFDKNDLLWMSSYNQGDRVLFQSSNHNLDTLLIKERTLYSPSNHFVFDLWACNWAEGDNSAKANASFDFKLSNYNKTDDVLFDGTFILYKDKDNQAAKVTFSLSGLYSRTFDSISFCKVLILNKTINDCVIVDKRNSEVGEGQSEFAVKSFVWSKHLGLVRYELQSGEIFEYVGPVR